MSLIGPTGGIVAHTGELLPHDVWTAWNLEPTVVMWIAVVVALHQRGRRGGHSARDGAFAGGMAAVVVALLSPIDAMSSVLASAHMVQHVLLAVVAAPLLAWSAPGPAVARGTPSVLRRQFMTVRLGLGLDHRWIQRLRAPVARWLLFVALLWAWHSAVLYGAALDHDAVHLLQHASFLGAAFLVWSSILGPARVRVAGGFAPLMVFTLALQNVFLALLLTFSTEPWYDRYVTTAPTWNLAPLADQHLAGAIMWVPVGLVHTAIALVLFAGWIRQPESGTASALSPRRAEVGRPR